VLALVFGIQLKNTNIAAAVSYQGKILGGAIGFFVVMWFFAFWSWAVVRQNKHRWATYVYAFFLFISALVFLGIAIYSPIIKRTRFKDGWKKI